MGGLAAQSCCFAAVVLSRYALTALVAFDAQWKAWPIAFMLHNTENYWSTRKFIEAVRRNIPCSRASCSHPFTLEEYPRGGFGISRACSSAAAQWPFIICDKLGSQVRALRRNAFGELFVILCQVISQSEYSVGGGHAWGPVFFARSIGHMWRCRWTVVLHVWK